MSGSCFAYQRLIEVFQMDEIVAWFKSGCQIQVCWRCFLPPQQAYIPISDWDVEIEQNPGFSAFFLLPPNLQEGLGNTKTANQNHSV